MPCRYGNDINTGVEEALLDYIHNETQAHHHNLLAFRNKMIKPPGHQLREGRFDRLIDMCLYFIPPHHFSSVDLHIIKALARHLVVIPVCAKADSMTSEEKTAFQAHVRSCLEAGMDSYCRMLLEICCIPPS